MQERRTVTPLIAGAASVVAVDQLTKWLAVRHLSDGNVVHLLGSLQLHLVHNRGSAFGLGARFAPLLALFAAGVVLALLRSRHHVAGWLPVVALALLIGGATGNLLDRSLRDGHGFLGGAVIDFVDLQWWPVFNVADSAITVGAVLLALTAQRERES